MAPGPPSPTTLLQAQLVVAKAAASKKQQKKGKAKASKKAGTPAKSTSKAKLDKENVEPTSEKGNGKAIHISFSWTSDENLPLSDTLLSIVEDSAMYKTALGFNKGDVGSVSTGGKKVVDIYCEIAFKVFINVLGSKYSNGDLEVLKDITRNRITALKKGYKSRRAMMSETGQGLLDSGRADEMSPGSDIKNLWDKIQATFPWYMRLHALMGSSPIVDKSAVSHSTSASTSLDLLDRAGAPSRPLSPVWDIERDDASLHAHSDDTAGHEDHSDNMTDAEDNINNISDEDVPRTPKCEQEMPRGSKRKASMMEQIAEVTKSERQNRFKIAAVNAKAKTLRAIEKEKIKRRAGLELEATRLQHHAQEAAAIRAHEVCMMDMQIALVAAKAGNSGGPAPHAPFGLDPTLH